MTRTIIHKVRMGPMPGNPFPDSMPLSSLAGQVEFVYGTPYAVMSVTDQHVWVRCECPWWHRLPFVGRRVHEDLP